VKQIYVGSYFGSGYYRSMKYVDDVTGHPQRQEIEQRIEVIKFFEDYGEEATRRAFHKSRATVYLWKQKLRGTGGKLSALAPGDRTPLHKRHRVVHPFIERFIIEYRTAHPAADKTTMAPALKKACICEGITPVSESTVGRIIHDLKERGKLARSTKITINGMTGELVARQPRPRVKKMRRKGYLPRLPGDLVQIDTVAVFVAGLKRYIFTALDVSTRFAFAYTYKANSSANGDDFLGKFLKVAPFAIRNVQTDNGSEFVKHFDDRCTEAGLTHFFNYPRHPQSNGYLERFNRTVQEQFVYLYEHYLDDLPVFNLKLMDYLIWYNTEKPHRGIQNAPPLQFYIDHFLTPEKSNMLWTLTPV
jgi:putative transposase